MTYYIDPFGCVKNQVDAENMMLALNNAGWTAKEDAAAAELIIINSCGFIESAKRESVNAVLTWRKLYPKKKILLAGCLAERYAKELSETLNEADGLFGLKDPGNIIQAAAKILRKKPSPLPSVGGSSGSRPLLSPPGTAYVKISDGCNNCCSYCAIPLIRGSLKSRSISDIIKECKTLLARGIIELNLVGQDLASFGKELPQETLKSLPLLMEELSRLKGKYQIRLLYIHPDHFPLSILDIMEKDRRFIPYFDIPFQHASAKILKAMNRCGNAKSYLSLIKNIRQKLPDAVIRSTFMTGFPGETEEDFALLLNFQKKARLDWLGCFAYSREENTPSYNMKGKLAKKLALERKRIIEEKQVPITEKQMDRFIGRVFPVLVEEKFEPSAESATLGSDDPALYLGRLPFQAPEVDGAAVIFSSRPLLLGREISCRITSRAGFDLKAEPINYPA